MKKNTIGMSIGCILRYLYSLLVGLFPNNWVSTAWDGIIFTYLRVLRFSHEQTLQQKVIEYLKISIYYSTYIRTNI